MPMVCLQCSYMICKQYFVYDEKWTGYCLRISDAVRGDDPCRWTKQLQFDFFSDDNNEQLEGHDKRTN